MILLTIQNLKFNVAMKSKIFLFKKYMKEKISKYIGKYVGFLELFDINLVFLSIISAGITTVSFM